MAKALRINIRKKPKNKDHQKKESETEINTNPIGLNKSLNSSGKMYARLTQSLQGECKTY